jgi:gluconokinase
MDPFAGDEAPSAQTLTVVLTGVSGAGKSTVAHELARLTGWRYADGDDFQSAENIDRMSSGHPLTDADRRPWLESIARWIGARERAGQDAIVTCSALKRRYRDLLTSGHPSVWFAVLVGDEEELRHRTANRPDHFMPAALLTSQLNDLEPLAADERGASIDVAGSPDRIAEVILERLALRG